MMTPHQQELLKRFGYPMLIVVAVLFVYWYFTRNSAATGNVLNASQSGVPLSSTTTAGNGSIGGGAVGGTPLTNGSPDTTQPGINQQTPQMIYPGFPNTGVDVQPSDISRLTHNFPPAWAKPGTTLGKNKDGDCCGSCAPKCNDGGSTRYTDSQNTVLAASRAIQLGSIHGDSIATNENGLMTAILNSVDLGTNGDFAGSNPLGPGLTGISVLPGGAIFYQPPDFAINTLDSMDGIASPGRR